MVQKKLKHFERMHDKLLCLSLKGLRNCLNEVLMMRDLTKSRFNSNNPERNFYFLNEKIEALEGKINRMEQELIEIAV